MRVSAENVGVEGLVDGFLVGEGVVTWRDLD